MNTLKTNPFLTPSSHNDQAFAFDKIETSHYLEALDVKIKENQTKFSKIIENQESPTFENTLKPYYEIQASFQTLGSILFQLYATLKPEELSEINQNFSLRTTEFSLKIFKDPVFVNKVEVIYKKEKEENSLDQEARRALELMFQDMTLEGCFLNPKDQEKINEIEKELINLSNQFSKNLFENQKKFRLHVAKKEDVEGIPEDCLKEAQELAKKENQEGWCFTFLATSSGPFLSYCPSRKLREQMYRALKKADLYPEFDSRPIVLKITKLRLKKAKILGFSNFADFKLKSNMAQSSEKVFSFLDELLLSAHPKASKEFQELKDFSFETDGIKDLEPWDQAYYSQKLMKKQLTLDSEKLREYFPLEKVLEGFFECVRRLYDLEFKETSDYPVYEQSMKVYEVYRKQKYQGLIYMDLFSRQTKRAGAWAMTLKPFSLSYLGQRSYCHSLICCNFPKAQGSTPSLLTLSDARTLFHELGHALHSLLSETKMETLAGTSVFRDFVELPSQIMENWMYEKEVLDLISHHYKTKEKLPSEFQDKIKQTLQFQSGMNCLRQLSFGFLDMAWHTLTDKDEISDVVKFENQAMKKASLYEKFVEEAQMSCGFQHIFCGGYSANYYGYKWSEVLDADSYELFQETGIFNKDTAEKFRSSILSRGNTEDPNVLYKKFRGREPNTKALLKRDGFIR